LFIILCEYNPAKKKKPKGVKVKNYKKSMPHEGIKMKARLSF